MKNKVKILLPNEQSITSDDVDLFLSIDLSQKFNTLKRERFDNDFDLSQQFVKERNASRNFIIYGVITSTVVDCPNLSINVFSDSGRTDQIAIITPTTISYNQNNVFGKKNAKYFIKLENCPYESIFFRIESDNFSYRDQDWSQKLVFTDADGNYVPYGTNTFDVNADGNSSFISNDFPFFFNKHWIRLDMDMVEEKTAKISFNIGTQTLSEGQSGQLSISLDKPSPFGLEIARINLVSSSDSFNSYDGSLLSILDISPFSRVDGQDPTLSQYDGKVSVIVNIPSDKSYLIEAGYDMEIVDGGYSGIHRIAFSRSIVVESYSDIYQVILDVDYDVNGTNGTISTFHVGTRPDIAFSMNGQPISFPLDIFWQQNEIEKVIDFTVNNDFDAEFTEFVDLEIVDLLRCRDGNIMQSRIVLEDNTTRNYVSLFLGPSYANSLYFTGRTYIGHINNTQTYTTSSHAILRNGYRFEGKNEEFYPTIGYTLKIKNRGGRTLLPINPDLGTTSETIFDIGETKEFYLPTIYSNDQRHSIKLIFENESGSNSGINSQFSQDHDGQIYCVYINGVDATSLWRTTGYNAFKLITSESSYNIYNLHGLDMPFDVEYNDDELSAILTSKSSGVKIEFECNDESVVVSTIVPFFEKLQEERVVTLLANSNNGNDASYEFSFEMNGYRKLSFLTNGLIGSSAPIPYYLVTSYSNIMRPYNDDLEQPYYGSGSTIDGLLFHQIDDIYPTKMTRGNAFINGIAFLSENNLYGSNENLTQYGIVDGQFVGGFLPSRNESLPGTFESVVEYASRKVIELKIPYSPYYDPYVRSFEFRFGNSEENTYLIGGDSYTLMNNAQWWWHNNIPASIDGVALPIATLEQRLDTGNSDNVIEGPVHGEVISPNVIRLISKNSGVNFSINNIVNYSDSDTYRIMQEVIVPNVIEGDVNPSNNGMGGFSI